MNVLFVAALLGAPPPSLDFSPLEVKSPVITWKEVEWKDTTGRMARWSWPSDPRLQPVFIGYVAPAVATTGNFHAGHQCPTCGRSQFTISGYNRDGTHNHACAYDGTTWRH